MTEDAQGADADVLSVGGEPAEDPGRGGSRLRLLIIAETAALIALIVVTLHYRAEAGQLHHKSDIDHLAAIGDCARTDHPHASAARRGDHHRHRAHHRRRRARR